MVNDVFVAYWPTTGQRVVYMCLSDPLCLSEPLINILIGFCWPSPPVFFRIDVLKSSLYSWTSAGNSERSHTAPGKVISLFSSFLPLQHLFYVYTSERNGNHPALFLYQKSMLDFRKKSLPVLFVTVAPPAVRSLSNGRTPSLSSEEEEQSLMKNTDSASTKSEDLKSEVSTADSDLLCQKMILVQYHHLFSLFAGISCFHSQFFLSTNIFLSPEGQWFQVVIQLFICGPLY